MMHGVTFGSLPCCSISFCCWPSYGRENLSLPRMGVFAASLDFEGVEAYSFLLEDRML
jgi:hypothetical protein